MKAVRIHATGGRDQMKVETVDIPSADSSKAVIKVDAAGVNFIDTYFRTGLYPVSGFPYTLGLEGAGTVSVAAADPEAAARFPVGSKVAFYSAGSGAYAEYSAVPVGDLVRVPEGVEAARVAAAMVQGLTAHYLVSDTAPVRPGDTVLVQAGAGGTGALVIQMAKLRGATTVIATVGSAEKAEIARAAGADHTILYRETDFFEEVKKITDGKLCQRVFDGVGAATWEKSLLSVAPRGHLVLFGNASGAVPPVNPLLLAKQGSVSLCRPRLTDYIRGDEYAKRTDELFGWIRDGKVAIRVGAQIPLAEAARAHELLEGRLSSGKILIMP